jgi:hypothetical protein
MNDVVQLIMVDFAVSAILALIFALISTRFGPKFDQSLFNRYKRKLDRTVEPGTAVHAARLANLYRIANETPQRSFGHSFLRSLAFCFTLFALNTLTRHFFSIS